MRFSIVRAALPLSTALLLLTAGCFRQTGEIIEPTSTSDGQVAITRAPGNIGVFVPDEAATPPAPEGDLQTAAAPALDVTTTLPVATFTPESTIALVIVTSTPQYITPQIPLGFTTPDTPAPTVASVLDTTGLTRTPGQQSFILPDSSNILATPTNLPGVDDECIHVVQGGDSLYLIAITYGYTVSDILAVNPDLGDASAVIQPGDPIQLPLPECIDAESTADPDRTRTATPRPAPTETPAGPAGSQIHTVQPGDVLYNIAIQYGVTVNAIVQANNLSNPNALQVGQQLIIPPSS